MTTRRGPKRPLKFKTHLRAWRKHAKLTIEQLSEQTEISVASLSRLEKGKQPYSQGTLEAIADAIGCKPWEILAFDPDDAGREAWRSLESAGGETRAQIAKVLRALTSNAA